MDLLVTYPAGSTAETSAVAAVTRTSEGVLFAVERTPCHPESPRWPDQPADRCVLEPSPRNSSAHVPEEVPVECFEGYLLDGELGLGDPPTDPPTDPGSPGSPAAPTQARQALRCVVHRAPLDVPLAVGDKVSLRVDERYREEVSRSHSRCHLVSLALNAALAAAWRKDPPARDSLGNPDFDKLAIVTSKIDEEGSLDVYRVGKHLRKTGFSAEALNDSGALAGEVARIAQGWLRSSPEISVNPSECRLEERRTWSCLLPEGEASFPCGGTHPSQVESGERVAVAISWDPQERHLSMRAKGGPLDV